MKAVVYQGPFSVSVEEVPDPELQHPNDVIVKITSSCICGSDLHMYEGRTAAEPGIIFGHENMGVIEEVGPAVKSLSAGDRVVMPFNVGCGFCKNCQRGFTGFCVTVNPGFAGGAYGYVAMGPWRGGQAEYPPGSSRGLQLSASPGPGMTSSRISRFWRTFSPTGYHGTELANVSPRRECGSVGRGPRRSDGHL